MYDNIIITIIMKMIRRERPALASPQNPVADVPDNITYTIYVETRVSAPYINTNYTYIRIIYHKKSIIYMVENGKSFVVLHTYTLQGDSLSMEPIKVYISSTLIELWKNQELENT